MKTIIFTLLAAAALTTTLKAQEQPADVKPVLAADTIVVNDTTVVNDTIDTSEDADTSIIRIGKKEIIIIDNDNDNDNDIDNDNDNDDDNEDNFSWCFNNHHGHKTGKFNGHWSAIELGFNGFDKEDYSQYASNEFMALNQGKSMEVNINFYEMNIGLVKSYVGLVSGMGLTFNSYRFDNDYTLQRGPQRTEPVVLTFDDLSKTKLVTSYLKVPLLLEFQIPVNQKEGRLFLNAGVVGGVKIGSHTKVKHGDTKDKDRNGFNINDFNYAATARIGYKDVGLYGTYSLTSLFKTDKGPELTPFSIGISLGI